MAEFVIIPDTSSDMNAALRERFDIPDYLRGIVYFPDGHSETADLDWANHDPKTFYESMSGKKAIYKTACAPMGSIIEVFEKQLKQGKDILCITLSSALSGTFQTCELATQQLLEAYPERKIICIDSLRYSTALTLLVIAAAQKKAEGASLEETAAFIEEYKHHVHQFGPMDDLFFLCKTGRISNFKAFFGNLVGINPMGDFNRKGMTEVLTKAKGKKAAFDVLLKYMEKTIIEPENQIIFVGHSNRLAAAELLRDMILEKFQPKEVIINDIGMACGASVGPGLCAAYYYGQEISEDMSREKAIIQEITNK